MHNLVFGTKMSYFPDFWNLQKKRTQALDSEIYCEYRLYGIVERNTIFVFGQHKIEHVLITKFNSVTMPVIGTFTDIRQTRAHYTNRLIKLRETVTHFGIWLLKNLCSHSNLILTVKIMVSENRNHRNLRIFTLP